MEIIGFTVGPFAEKTYLLIEKGEALIVDPGFSNDPEFKNVKNKLREHDAVLKALVLTHAHVDHILGLNRVIDEFDLPIYYSDKDPFLWNNYPSQAGMFGFQVEPIKAEPEKLSVQKDWTLGNFKFEVRYTPGHSPDHIVLYSKPDNALIAGDTIFKQGIGRTDLYKGDFKTLEHSIRNELYTLPDETEVYPGHGPKTTIAYEKQNNPFVKEG